MLTAIVTPAYGRDYKIKDEATADWEVGKDFILQNVTDKYMGKPCNILDLKNNSDYTHVNIRFNKKKDVVRIEL